MPKLRDIQEQFARHLQGLPTSPAIADQVQFNQLENVNRLQVYRNNFRLSLTGNLAAIYPVLKKLVGEQFFNYACKEFIRDYPSRHGNLHEYGVEFADFIEHFDPARSLRYLADMARLEWAYHEVFHEAAGGRLDTQALQNVKPEHYPDIVFFLHPATRILESRYPLIDIWQTNQEEKPQHIVLNQKDYFFLVGRRNNENVFQTLSKLDYDFLSMVESQQRLQTISERLRPSGDESVIDLDGLLVKHVATGNICKFEISQEPQ